MRFKNIIQQADYLVVKNLIGMFLPGIKQKAIYFLLKYSVNIYLGIRAGILFERVYLRF